MSFHDLLAAQRACFNSGATLPPAARRAALKKLRHAIGTNETRIQAALHTDLGKSAFEAYATEIGMTLGELRYLENHLAAWARPRRVATPLALFPARSRIVPEPFGVVLIIAPWNYPFQLVLAPLAAALAAGNCVTVKTSEHAPATAALVKELLGGCFPPEQVAVVEGDADATRALLEHRFDSIFFTGSTAVGRSVMAAAARHLTPVTLELGGKSPCIVAADADLAVAAKRIAWGKFLNAGQTCVAPDYLVVHASVKDILVDKLKTALRRFHGDDPRTSPDYPRIINHHHFDRLAALLATGGRILAGGGSCREERYIAPTLLDGIGWDAPLMQEEIFGPLLPILTYAELPRLLARLREQPAPLAAYVFSRDRQTQEAVMHGFPFGGGCINDTVMHLANPRLPFGGRGASGLGTCHGKAGFNAFTHFKSVLDNGTFPDLPLRYPPYAGKLALLKRLL